MSLTYGANTAAGSQTETGATAEWRWQMSMDERAARCKRTPGLLLNRHYCFPLSAFRYAMNVVWTVLTRLYCCTVLCFRPCVHVTTATLIFVDGPSLPTCSDKQGFASVACMQSEWCMKSFLIMCWIHIFFLTICVGGTLITHAWTTRALRNRTPMTKDRNWTRITKQRGTRVNRPVMTSEVDLAIT